MSRRPPATDGSNRLTSHNSFFVFCARYFQYLDFIFLPPFRQDIINNQPRTITTVDGAVSAASAAAQVARLLNTKMALVDNVAAKAQAVYATPGDYSYTASADLSGTDGDVTVSGSATTSDALGGYPVCGVSDGCSTGSTSAVSADLDHSRFVTASFNVVESDVAETFALEETFVSNYEDDQAASGGGGIASQFFGSANGVLRYWPSVEWTREGSDGTCPGTCDGDVDSSTETYLGDEGAGHLEVDPRLTPWYARAVSGPKNVVIVLGATTAYGTQAALNVLKTISMDDYVAVVDAKTGNSISVCSTGAEDMLVRGTVENVEMLMDEVNSLGSMSGGAKGKDAMNTAFDLMTTTEDAGALIGCESVVVVISGSSDGFDVDHINGLNEGRQARIFTHIDGSNAASDTESMRAVACENFGDYNQIDSNDAAAEVGLYYLQINAMDWSDDQDVEWTLTYGLGLRPDLLRNGEYGLDQRYLTMAKAVYSTPEDDSVPALLGVAALDMDMFGLKDSLDTLNYQKSFPFVVNNEGDTLYHPLQTKYKSLVLYDTGRDISNYESFDSFDSKVRESLVKGNIGEVEFEVDRPLPKGDATFEGVDTESTNTWYFWQPVPQWPLSLAFAYADEDLTQKQMELSRYDNDEVMWRMIDDFELYRDADACDDCGANMEPTEGYETMHPYYEALIPNDELSDVSDSTSIFNHGNCVGDQPMMALFDEAMAVDDTGAAWEQIVEWSYDCTGSCVPSSAGGASGCTETDTCTVIFSNCKADAVDGRPETWCTENNMPESMCEGTCICEQHRWPVNTIGLYSNYAYAPQCYQDPKVAFLGYDFDTAEETLQWSLDHHRFTNRERNTINPDPIVKRSCLQSAQISGKFQKDVKEAEINRYHDGTVWSYVGFSTGTLSLYPANNWGNAYDPTRRPWYSRAIAYKGQFRYVITTPYVDAGGAGLMNSFTAAIWENQPVTQEDDGTWTYGEIEDDRVIGVHGWDMLYPQVNAWPALFTGCMPQSETSNIYSQRADDVKPMCFLMDPAGLLLTHSDFMITEAAAAFMAGDTGVGGDTGVWPIENVFVGKKEPQLAQALLDAGFFVEHTGPDDDNDMLLSWFEADMSVLDSDGYLSGSFGSDRTCYKSGAVWHIGWVADSNAFLLVVDNYEIETLVGQDGCEELMAAAPVADPDESCDVASTASQRTRGRGMCSLRVGRDVLEMETQREFNRDTFGESSSSAGDGTCKDVFYMDAGEEGLIFIVIAALSIVAALALFVILFSIRKTYVMKTSSPVFGYLMILGALFGFIFVFMLTGKPTDGTCMGRNWFAGLSFTLLFAPLFAKTWRIHRVFNNKSMRKVRITNADLFKPLGAIGLVQSVLLAAWSAMSPPKAVEVPNPNNPLESTIECEGEGFNTYLLIEYIICGCVVVFGVYLCYQTRNVQMGEFNESSQIAGAIYNIFIMGIVIIPMIHGLDVDLHARFVLESVGVLITCLATLGMLFIPKIIQRKMTKDDFAVGSSHGTSASTSLKTGSGENTTSGDAAKSS
jgi:hypothetical protein